MKKPGRDYVGLVTQVLLPEQVSKEAIKLPDKTGDIVARPIEIVVKCSFVLLKVIDVKKNAANTECFLESPDVSCSVHSFHKLWRT
ncbi:TPA: hypothetical protein PPG19_004408 [Escherichia coli]|nr:hypothetical protein [Escherichia coli]